MEKFDVIIIGSGPAGLTAAIYTTRASLKTLIVAGAVWGGQLQLTTDVENFPGFPDGIQGPDIMTAMRKQAEKFGAEFIDNNLPETDFSSQPQGGPFSISVNGKDYKGKAILVATGENSKWLDVPGEKERIGRGVSSCAPCDAPFFRNKNIIVVGGGDSAMEEALVLTHFASHVTIVHRRDSFRASNIMVEKAKNNPKISFLLNSEIVEIMGEGKVQAVKIKTQFQKTQNTQQTGISDNQIVGQSDISGSQSFPSIPKESIIEQINDGIIWKLSIEGIFVAIGHTPNTQVFKGIELKEGGYVKGKNWTTTNIEGVFVSGDVEDDRYRQAVTAAGFGCMAALDIERWLREKSS